MNKILKMDEIVYLLIFFISQLGYVNKYQNSCIWLSKYTLMMNRQSTKSINQTRPKNQHLLDTFNVPILDLESEDFGDRLVEDFKNIGFVMIRNHGIMEQEIDMAFQKAKLAFQMSAQAKRGVGLRSDSQKNRGYTGPGEQFEEQENKANEKKETFDLGHPEGPGQLRYYPKVEGFTEISKTMYEKLFDVYKKILVALQGGLKLEKGHITKKCSKDFYDQTLRYLYYPEITVQQLQKSGKLRTNPHSDYGTITLLFQKPGFGQNGLRALNPEQHWVKVHPPDYCIVVNLGDLFHQWTNDALKSTIHKVEVDDEIFLKIKNGELQTVPERQTIVLFCDPDQNQIFQCLPGFGQPKYAPINGKKYVFGRLEAVYGNKK